jgi:homeobox protein cut-like
MEGDEGAVFDNATTVEKEVSRPVVLLPAGAQTFSSASPISVVYAFWKDFDLETWRVQLDDQGLQIGKNQESSLKNRRKLAESTRDFKKASQEEKTKSFPALLKGYQEEVDNLTKRAKFGENAFLNIYQKLYEAPDPAPALSSATELAGKIAELELENRKMKQELEEYHTETAYLKNQQATVRRLEERNRLLEQQMEEKVKEIVDMKQRSLAEENQKNLEALNEREKLLQDQLRAATQSVQNMQRLHEYGQSQLFDLQAQSEEISAAKQSELNLLTDEVDRAQSRLLSLEREKVYSIFHAYGIFVSVMQLQGNSVRVAEVGTGLQLLLVAVSLDFQQNLSAFSYHVNHVLC